MGAPEERDGDSLRPLIEVAWRSTRLRVWGILALKWAVLAVVVSCIQPGWQWMTTRYDKARGEKLERRVAVIERLTGLPERYGTDHELHTVNDPEDVVEGRLRDRIGALERVREDYESNERRHDYEWYGHLVSVWVAQTEPRGSPRAASVARAAFKRYSQIAGCAEYRDRDHDPDHKVFRCEVAPAEAARPVLETPVPK